MQSSYRQILVHLDATRASTQRLQLARAIAARQDAALAALYAVTPSFMALSYELGPATMAELAAMDEERRQQAFREFDQATRGDRPVPGWAQTGVLPVVGTFVAQALYADLLVLGQAGSPDAPAGALPADFVESVLSASGRPALVMPHIGAAQAPGATVAIAWKPTPEAARAVTGAMPFLQRAQQVHVLTWGTERAQEPTGTALGLASYLGAHGVKATWHAGGPEPADIGALMLSRVFDLGADLLVMGCYGHGRAREWILGGASRTLLASMTLPVLMSH